VASALYDAAPQSRNWRADWAAAYKSIQELVDAGFLQAHEAKALEAVGATYRISVPRYYANLIDRTAQERCPIRMQALPSLAEIDPVLPNWAQAWSNEVYGRAVPWSADPIGDVVRLAAPRLSHRYGNRAIMHVSAACALYCRFFFL
jgi:lysine 2,3-aminomutase